jgi:hypothetical protein
MLRSTQSVQRLAAVLALSAALGASGCEDPFEETATYENGDATHELWALTGTPTSYPSVLYVAQRIVERPDPSASFDLGFDINGSGQLLVLPVSHVLTSLSGDRSVDFIVPGLAFAEVTEAPRTGWLTDTTLTLDVGDVFIVRVSTLYCANLSSDVIFAKYHVDSVIVAERRIKLSTRVNPNCGFRSFADGLPLF